MLPTWASVSPTRSRHGWPPPARWVSVRPRWWWRSSESTADPAGLAAALGVEHLLVGTIQPADQTYRVTVQLVRADGVAVWGSTYDEPRTALLILQDRLAEHVVSALRIELAASDRARLHVKSTNNPDAYDRYLRGRSLLLNYTEANMRLGDSSSSSRRSSSIRTTRWPTPGSPRPAPGSASGSAHRAEEYQWAKRADEEARRALALDGSLAEAHLASASAAGTPFGGYNWTAVFTRTTDALALDPSLEFAHLARMRAYYHLGLFQAAAREGREAARLNPGNSVEFERLDVAVLLFGGEFARAVARARRCSSAPTRRQCGTTSVSRSTTPAMRTAGAPCSNRSSAGPLPIFRAQASLASIEAASGRRTEARARLAQILRRVRAGSPRRVQRRRGVCAVGRGIGRLGMAGTRGGHRLSLLPVVRAGSAAGRGANGSALRQAADPSSGGGPGRAPSATLIRDVWQRAGRAVADLGAGAGANRDAHRSARSAASGVAGG